MRSLFCKQAIFLQQPLPRWLDFQAQAYFWLSRPKRFPLRSVAPGEIFCHVAWMREIRMQSPYPSKLSTTVRFRCRLW